MVWLVSAERGLASWLVSAEKGLASWLVAAGCGSEFCFNTWSCHPLLSFQSLR